jgi:hypothetical protein
MGNAAVDDIALPLPGKAQQIPERLCRPLQAVPILIQRAHGRDFTCAADEDAIGLARIADQRRQGVDTSSARLDVQHGDGIAADIKLMQHACGNDGGAAGQPRAVPDPEAERPMQPGEEHRSAMLVTAIVNQRPDEEGARPVEMPEGVERTVGGRSTFIQALPAGHR